MYVVHWSCSKAESRGGWDHLDLLKHPLSWELLQSHKKSLDTPSLGRVPSDPLTSHKVLPLTGPTTCYHHTENQASGLKAAERSAMFNAWYNSPRALGFSTLTSKKAEVNIEHPETSRQGEDSRWSPEYHLKRCTWLHTGLKTYRPRA